jgi:hypothetical protein
MIKVGFGVFRVIIADGRDAAVAALAKRDPVTQATPKAGFETLQPGAADRTVIRPKSSSARSYPHRGTPVTYYLNNKKGAVTTRNDPGVAVGRVRVHAYRAVRAPQPL